MLNFAPAQRIRTLAVYAYECPRPKERPRTMARLLDGIPGKYPDFSRNTYDAL